jgi:hypothetical protein
VSDYTVHDEEGFARVYDEDDMVEIRRGDLRAILDVATGSMDFGSGFLDNEQVEAIRLVAQMLGIDPLIVTPRNFVCLYNGEHQWKWQPNWNVSPTKKGGWWCPLCHHTDTERPAPTSTEERLNDIGFVVMKSPLNDGPL